MIMPVTKHLWSLVRLVLPGVGLALACVGAYLMSLEAEYKNSWKLVPAYIMIAFGFLAILTGVFWTLCHSMKSKMYQRQRHELHIQVYTIERPSSFPPSYEESQGSRVCSDEAPHGVVVLDGPDVALSPAPPLYSRYGSEAPDCRWSWERPPRYSLVERPQQGPANAEERREDETQH